MENIDTSILMVTIGLVVLFVIFVQAKNATRTYDIEEETDAEPEYKDITKLTETGSLNRRITEHERRVEEKLEKIYGTLNFFKTLVIIQLFITAAGIIWAISVGGNILNSFAKILS